MVKDPRNNHINIISLAYYCGFISESAFYTTFKHYTIITPTEYRNKLQKEHHVFLSN